jgi:hypothetical protein
MDGTRASGPRLATVVAMVVLVIALGGSAIALPGRNKVGAGDIRRAAVRAAEIQDGSVGSAEIGDNAVRSQEIRDGSVRAGDIADSTIDPEDLGPGVRLWANVNPNANLVSSSRKGVTVARTPGGDGRYLVDFNAREVTKCAVVAQLRSYASGEEIPTGTVGVAVSPQVADSIRVDTADSTGAKADLGFSLIVFC